MIAHTSVTGLMALLLKLVQLLVAFLHIEVRPSLTPMCNMITLREGYITCCLGNISVEERDEQYHMLPRQHQCRRER